MTRSFVTLTVVIVAACACGGPDHPSGDDDAPPGLDDSPRGYDAIGYALRARFDWDARRLFAAEDVTLVLPADIAPHIELDSKVEVKRVFAGATQLTWRADVDASTLSVDLTPIVDGTAAPITFTIEYEAPTSGALIASFGRADDPIASRVVYSDSEPDRGVGWLVANHRPSDRATFAVELTVPSGEDVLGNGERVRDEVQGDSRVVGYAIDQPIPTYIMAFAAGELEHHDRAGRVPLSIWYRRGVQVDHEAHLDQLAAQLAALEPLVGPYPWSRYSVALMPEFPAGGMENATITFNSEPTGQGHISYATNAHELGHHWFGDWVTMRRLEDAWFKEGMATVLQWEAGRAFDDPGNTGRLFGNFFQFNGDDAIVDLELTGIARYTSGIYDRAAWMITQIRALVGEDAFWSSLRGLLAAHALDSIDGETFVRGFAPALPEATIRQILAGLPSKQPPSLAVAVASLPSGDRDVTLTLTDPDGAMIAPMTITVVDAAGAATEQALVVGTPLHVTVPIGGYLAPDEHGVHVTVGRGGIELENPDASWYALFIPSAAPAITALTARSPVHQERGLQNGFLPFDPAGLATFYAALDSRTARQAAEADGCQSVRFVAEGGGDPGGWIAALTPILQAPALPLFDTQHGICGQALATATFGAEIAATLDAITATNAERLLYLMGFDYGPATSFDLMSRVAVDAPSLLLRDRAISRLVAALRSFTNYVAPPDSERPRWRSFFHDRLVEARSPSRYFAVWEGADLLDDDAAPAVAGAALHALRFSASQQRAVVCDAYHLAQRVRPAAFDELVAAAAPVSTLSTSATGVLANPALCDQPAELRRAPARHEPSVADAPAALRAGR